MSKIDYQALREVEEAAKGDTTWQNLQAFHAAATPEVVQALLDENERLCRELIARNGEIEGLRKWAEELEAREVALPVASCIVEDGCMCVDGFGEYVGHSLPDGTHQLYTAPPAQVVPEAEPVAWTDEEELRDVKRYGLGEIFQYPPDKYADSRRVIPLYRVPPASIVQAQGIEIAINELVALSPRLDKRAAETLSMAVAQLRKLVKKQIQAKD
ncbi:ead/Ea22-like family protein [Escherichia coli]|nr:ead/Ea22-like family protein [Escherichia coli]